MEQLVPSAFLSPSRPRPSRNTSPGQVEVIETYVGDACLVTVAGYDGSFAADPSYEDYGLVYNGRSQASPGASLGFHETKAPYLIHLSSSLIPWKVLPIGA